jgi:acyl-[acyl-carrier-protein] desaturase
MTATQVLLDALTPAAEALFERHQDLAREWMPHEYVPWGEGRDFVTEPFEPSQSSLPEIAQISFEVNLLTEDNLPSYHREIATAFGRDSIWGEWVGQWTAEEGRHALCMRDYLLLTRGVDPIALERARMAIMKHGYSAEEKTPLGVIAYVSFQELATRISHRNTGKATEDPIAEKLLARIAADENLHMIFYRGLADAALKYDPSAMAIAISQEVIGFQMPGTGIVDFEAKAKRIARAGIYDLRIHHDEVVQPLLRHWDYFNIEGLNAEAEQAREQLAGFLAGLDGLATRYDAIRARREASLTR